MQVEPAGPPEAVTTDGITDEAAKELVPSMISVVANLRAQVGVHSVGGGVIYHQLADR